MMNSPSGRLLICGQSPNSRPASVSSVGSVHSTTSDSTSSCFSSGRGPRRGQDICVSEEFRLAVDLSFARFQKAAPEEYEEMDFPSSLTASERAYIHRLAATYGLKSLSKGKGNARAISVSRKPVQTLVQSNLQLSVNSQQQISALVHRLPLTVKERQDLIPRTEKSQPLGNHNDTFRTTAGRLNNGLPQIPPRKLPSEVVPVALPILSMRKEIVKAIWCNQVVMVSGETGCGKTTQVPQMILEECCTVREPCRIFCTQPRRISALSVADRVAAERGETLGQAIGYQIRLESRVSPKTLVTFCTNGVLLRTLMGGDNALATVTHVIVDEVHERDKLCDFLLLSLRQALPKYPNLRLVLMSATLNVELFAKYFNNCPIITVPGTLFEVTEYFLEDVIKWTNYSTKKMLDSMHQLEKLAEAEGRGVKALLDEELSAHGVTHDADDEIMASIEKELRNTDLSVEKDEVDAELSREMDKLLTDIWMTGNEDLFVQVFHLILSENVSADFQHSETGITPLMAACSRGMTTAAEQLINLGANLNVKALQTGWTALDVALKFQHDSCVELLQSYTTLDASVAEALPMELSSQDKMLLEAYHHSFDDEKVDLPLLVALLHKIASTTASDCAVLVFLPGYDEIVTLRDMILGDNQRFNPSGYVLYVLHSNMQSSDQKRVFKRPPQGVRKLILATNIAEASITIDDVVHVIDSGKVKEKSFDALSGVSMLKSNWISKASARQRAGRAGRCRPGFAYHLFSSARYKNMLPFQIAEILRTPLQELCLHAKLLAPVGDSIADYLSNAPQPPSMLVTRNAVQILKQMDALDPFEDLTELGYYLIDLPIEPRLGKMILCAVVLKCLDPVLTIACTLSYKEPFVLPSLPADKRAAAKVRQKFAADSLSDHMSYLRVFQSWQRARTEGYERSFCQSNFVSSATMEMIVGMRTQILGQLRASGFVKAKGAGDIRDVNANSEVWPVVKASLCAGLYPNLLRVDRTKMQLQSQKESKVKFHQSSVLWPSVGRPSNAAAVSEEISRLPSDWLCFEEITRSVGQSNMRFASAHARCATVVSPITVALFAGPAKLPLDATKDLEGMTTAGCQGSSYDNIGAISSDSDSEDPAASRKVVLALDSWITFTSTLEMASLVLQLRHKWHLLFLRRMAAPSKPCTPADEAILRTVIQVLTSEEQACGLSQPTGIGQRPRPMTVESMSGESLESQHSDESSGSSEIHSSKQRSKLDAGNACSNESPFDTCDDFGDTRSSESSSHHGSNTNSPSTSPAPMAGLADNQSPCRYFIVKCSNHKCLDISMNKGVWATTASNEQRLNKALQEKKAVFLIFSIQGSGHFQGFAQVMGASSKERCADFGVSGLGGAFPLQWIKRSNLTFQRTHDLLNPWNENKKVQLSRDGQELEPKVGEALIHLWDSLPNYYPRGNGVQRDDNSKGSTGPLSTVTILQRQPPGSGLNPPSHHL